MNTIAATASPIAGPVGDGPRYRGAFGRLLQTIRSMSPESFAVVNLDVMSAVRTTEGALPKIGSMKTVVAQLLPQFPLLLFEELEARALALGHAQTVYESAQHPAPILQTLLNAATTARDIALAEANTLVKRGLLPAQVLGGLKSGNGYRNLAADLFTLSETMKSHWNAVSSRTSMTREELDRLEDLADEMNQALGIREQMPELQAAAARDRQAAYTLFIAAYSELRAAIAYIRRRENDVETIMPSLYARRSSGKKKPAIDEPAEPTSLVAPTVNSREPVVVMPSVTPSHAVAETKVGPVAAMPIGAYAGKGGPFMH